MLAVHLCRIKDKCAVECSDRMRVCEPKFVTWEMLIKYEEELSDVYS